MTDKDTTSLVSARSVDVELGGRRILTGVDLEVSGGDLLGLVGPNGAGKTTLLRALLGLVPLAGGSVSICGTTPRRAARKVGYVPQRHTFAWDFPISVEQVVMTGRVRHLGWLRTAGVQDWKLVRRALKLVEMDELRHRTIGELSGGQKQRVLIARALATDPSVLVLDEPWTGIDMPTQELLTELLQKLAGQGTAVVMTTHDLAAAMASCGRIGLVNRGLVAQGTPAEMVDPALWMRTFGIGENSPLMASIRACAPSTRPEEIAC